MSNGEQNQNQNQNQAPLEQTKPHKEPKQMKKKKDGKKGLNINTGAIKETIINYIVPLASLAASGLIGFFILLPSYKDLPLIQAELEQKRQLESDLNNKLDNLNDLVDFQGVVEENSDLVNKVLVSEELVPGLLTQVDRIATESGMQVNRLNYGLGTLATRDQAESISYNIVTVNLGARGSFAQLKTFMKNIENAARLVLIDNFRYTLNETNEGVSVGAAFVLYSPYLFVESDAITDEPIDLDLDGEFLDIIKKTKQLKYYDPYEIDTSVPVIEATEEEGEEAEEEEVTVFGEQPPVETPSETPAESTTPEQPPAEESPTEEDGDSIFPQ